MDQQHWFVPPSEECDKTIYKSVMHCLGASTRSILKHSDTIENNIDLILSEDSAQLIHAQ
jgi:hypothetical protein